MLFKEETPGTLETQEIKTPLFIEDYKEIIQNIAFEDPKLLKAIKEEVDYYFKFVK